MKRQLVKVPATKGCYGCWYDSHEEEDCPCNTDGKLECEADDLYSLIFVEKEANTDENN